MSRSAIKAVFGITGVIMLSRILGMFREIVIAGNFGTSAGYDLYLIAIMLPALAYAVLNFAFYYLLVPYLTRQLESNVSNVSNLSNGEKGRLPSSVWSVFTGTMAVAIGVAGLIVIIAPYVMKLWGGSYTSVEYSKIVLYTRVVSAVVILGASEAFLRALLNSTKQFTYPAGGWIVFNLFSIGVISFGANRYGVAVLAIALVGGLVAQNIYLFVRLAFGGWFRGFSLRVRADELSAVWGTATVLVLVEMLGKSYFLIDRYFALPLGDGIVAALTYSNVLVVLPDSIVGFAIGTVLFPLFSEKNQVDRGKFGRLYSLGLSAGFMVALPVALFVYINASDIVRLIFMRGAFNSESLWLTATALKNHTPTIVAMFAISTSIRACYGRGWSRPVLFAGIGLLILKFVTTMLFSKFFGFSGITLATSLTQLLFALALILIIRAKMPEVLSGVGKNLLKISLAGSIVLVVLLAVQPLIGEMMNGAEIQMVLVRLFVHGVILASIYFGLIYLFGLSTLYRQAKAK